LKKIKLDSFLIKKLQKIKYYNEKILKIKINGLLRPKRDSHLSLITPNNGPRKTPSNGENM
jgi:hypothetical protein